MHTYLDGPAKGITLNCRRCPLLVRVAFDPRTKEWDALDLLADVPKPGETLYAYVLTELPASMFICFRGKNKAESGCHQNGRYRYLPQQPDQATMRDNDLWAKWAERVGPELFKQLDTPTEE